MRVVVTGGWGALGRALAPQQVFGDPRDSSVDTAKWAAWCAGRTRA